MGGSGDHHLGDARIRRGIENAADALFHDFGRIFGIGDMGVACDDVDLNRRNIVRDACKFVVADELVDSETAVGI